MTSLPWRGQPRRRGTSPRLGRQAAIRRRTIAGLERCEDRTLMATLFGVTAPGDLVRFDSATPTTIQNTTPIAGLGSGETILGIDFRPANGLLYALTSDASNVGRLYTVDTTSGAATLASTLAADPADLTAPYTALSGTAFGVDFNPVPDRLRVVSDAGQNLRINVANGLVTTDGDINPGTPALSGAAYINSFAGATATTLYVIDPVADTLSIQNPPNNGTLVPVGGLGVDAGAVVGFDVLSTGDRAASTSTAFAALSVGGATGFYTITLGTGVATSVGTIGDGTVAVVALAVQPEPTAVLVAANALGVDAANNLVRFNTQTPGTIVSSTPITGLGSGETILGIDFRPATGDLYALTSDAASVGRLYTVDTTSGAATLASTLAADPLDTSTPYTALSGTSFGVDFNPVPDRLRVVSDTGQNLRINVATGLVTTDGAINPGTPALAGAAYINSFAGATATTLYVIDPSNDTLSIQAPPNDGTLTGTLPLGVDASAVLGFDIRAALNTALATLVVGGTPGLYSINLTTGAASLIAAIGGGTTLTGLAIIPRGAIRFGAPTFVVDENGTNASITVQRVGGDDGSVSATVTLTGGTAIPGVDYDATPQTVSFPDGNDDPFTILIPINPDATAEDIETIVLTLSGATNGAVIGAPSTATLAIVDAAVQPGNAFGVNAAGSLVRFNLASPGTIVSTTPITGLQATETILGLDVRPRDGLLYALGSTGRLYTIAPGTGVATLVAALAADPTDLTAPFTALSGASFGVDFNPQADRLRVVSDTGQSLRINVGTGLVITDTALNPGTPAVTGAAYANNVVAATSTTLYVIDATTDQLLIQAPPNDGTLTPVGALGVDASAVVGFDIRSVGGVDFAYATLVVGGSTGLYTINLTTGAATLIGAAASPLVALAIAPTGFTATLSLTTATFVGTAANDAITFDASGGLLRHNRFTAGDAGFNSDFDFDSATPGDQTLSAAAGSSVVVQTGLGDDTVTIGSATAASSTLGATFTVDGEGGSNTLVVDDSASSSAAIINVSAVGVAGTGGTVTYVNIAGLAINAGSGGDTINVGPTPAGLVVVNAGGGDDTVSVAGLLATVSFVLDGGAGTDALTIDSAGAPVTTTASTITVGGTSIGVAAFEAIAISNAVAPAVTPTVDNLVVTGVAGDPFPPQTVATFTTTRAGALPGDFTATIDWGDGTPTSAGFIRTDPFNPTVFIVSGSHTYATAGSRTITTTIVDRGGTTTTTVGGASTTITFGQGPAATATAMAVINAGGIQLQATTTTVVAEGVDSSFVAATFTADDPGATASQFSATVSFGDGTPAVAGTITQTGTTFVVTARRTFANAGTVATTVTVTGGAAPASSTGQVTVTDRAVLVDTRSLFAVAGEELTLVEVARFGDPGGPSPVGSYVATIDWGDGTPTTTGVITFVANATFRVDGTHTYASAGFFPLTVTVRTAANATASGRGNVLVTAQTPDVPTTIGLSPDSDTGASDSDGITNDNTPTFTGQAQPGSVVTVFTRRDGTTDTPVAVGSAVVDAGGSFSITSGTILDGTYTVTTETVDPSGGVTPGASTSTIVIDTVGPSVASLSFRRGTRRLSLALVDDGSGIDPATAADAGNYRFAPLRGSNAATNLITRVVPTSSGPVTTVELEVNRGRALRLGRYRFLAASGGLADLAGNALDGEFTGTFPTGDGAPGGGLRAQFTSVHGRISGPSPVAPIASPLVAAQIHDLALGEMTVAQAKKKK